MVDISDALKTDIFLTMNSSGDLSQINGLANLKRALFRRLVTVPGTLVHRPTYGVGVGLYQNAPSSFSMQQKLAGIIQEQFELDPRVQSVTSVAVNSENESPQLTKIIVTLTPIGYTEQQMSFTPFNEANT